MSTSEPMTMPHPEHPDDELLAALAGSEPDAGADPSLVAHLADCPRCSAIVDGLRTLRSALAELPDITPSRPLRFLPPVPAAAAPPAGWAGLLRRLSAPVMGVAAALILVGALGTAASSGLFPQAASTASQAKDGFGVAQPAASAARGAGAPTATSTESQERAQDVASPLPGAAGEGTPRVLGPYQSTDGSFLGGVTQASAPEDALTASGSAPSRAPFEWILGAGVVLLAAAFLARAYARRRDTTGTV